MLYFIALDRWISEADQYRLYSSGETRIEMEVRMNYSCNHLYNINQRFLVHQCSYDTSETWEGEASLFSKEQNDSSA